MSSSYASFAPYQPPPDDPEYATQSTSTSKKASRPWFPSYRSEETSYQSGGVPTFNNSLSGGYGASQEVESQQNQWETRFGFRVDLMAASAYIFGPLSALLVLILETQNDFVRFHGYQSALLTGSLFVLRMLLSFLQFPQWIRSLFTIIIICGQLYMAFRAYIDATRNDLVRFQLPVVGLIADRWVSEE
ncbi:hypothetical protein Moror_13251 [Moniliophthora roreri MCA 2997]|uniref:Uncharacterized protein n=1 Tax=Moniliophthora roreri (strain MCA 2997) TaxID=1381753 RepID=V2YB12_MONRO|nr:hypothetical protein Moror_13251 [Moniliophthora roreri MCA 2997]